jgi:hypothetical protein
MSEVMGNLESQRRQYDLAQAAEIAGFKSVTVIDDDLGRSGSGSTKRPGFERLVAMVCSGDVGAVYCIEASPNVDDCGAAEVIRRDLDTRGPLPTSEWSRCPPLPARDRERLDQTFGIAAQRVLGNPTTQIQTQLHRLASLGFSPHVLSPSSSKDGIVRPTPDSCREASPDHGGKPLRLHISTDAHHHISPTTISTISPATASR